MARIDKSGAEIKTPLTPPHSTEESKRLAELVRHLTNFKQTVPPGLVRITHQLATTAKRQRKPTRVRQLKRRTRK